MKIHILKFSLLKFSLFCFICLLSFAPNLNAEEFFEGALTFRMGSQGKNTEMKYFMKGSKMRMQIELAPGMKSAGIADYEKKKMFMLLPQGNFYTETDIDDKVLNATSDKAFKKSDIQETDITADILGYNCTKLISNKNGEITEIWIAKGFGKFYQPNLEGENATFAALQRKFEEEKAFPFRIVSFSPDKKELFRMEVINIDKKSLDESLFEIPPGYKKINIPSGAHKGN